MISHGTCSHHATAALQMPAVQLPCARGSSPAALTDGNPQPLSRADPLRRGHIRQATFSVCAASDNTNPSCDSAGGYGRQSILASIAAAGNLMLSSHGLAVCKLLQHNTCMRISLQLPQEQHGTASKVQPMQSCKSTRQCLVVRSRCGGCNAAFRPEVHIIGVGGCLLSVFKSCATTGFNLYCCCYRHGSLMCRCGWWLSADRCPAPGRPTSRPSPANMHGWPTSSAHSWQTSIRNSQLAGACTPVLRTKSKHKHEDLVGAHGVGASFNVASRLHHSSESCHGVPKCLCRQKKKSAALADAATLGDAWLAPAIQQGALQPIPTPERWRWWVRLSLAQHSSSKHSGL